MQDNLRDSLIVNLTENRSQQFWNSLCCRKRPSKNAQLWQYLDMKLSFIFKFPLVLFAFSLILGDPFIVSPPLKYGKGRLFPQKRFSRGGKFMGVLLYMGGLMIRSCQERGVSQNAFSSNLNTANLKYSIEDKAQTILQNYGRIYSWSLSMPGYMVQRLSHFILGFDIVFEMLTP